MIINVVTQLFQIKSDLKADYSILSTYDLPTPTESFMFTSSFLSQNSLWKPVNQDTTSKIIYYRINPDGVLEETSLPFEAHLMKVIYSRDILEEKQIFYPSKDSGSAEFLLSGGKDGAIKIVEMKYSFKSIDTSKIGKYYCKPPETAWNEFSSGKGYVEKYGENGDATVNRMYLAFYDSLDLQDYLQPIWVFEGNKGFRGFISAVFAK